jgi:hypothetical protein
MNKPTPPPAVALALALGLLCAGLAQGQGDEEGALRKFDQPDTFRQLEEILPTPGTTRTASGAPGPAYWQQRADYVIDVSLDDERRRLTGAETVTYHNHSPDELRYLWFQLDQNVFAPDAEGHLIQEAPSFDRGDDEDARFSFRGFRRLLAMKTFEGGYDIRSVTDGRGNDLPHTIVRTMMRIDLPQPLAPGESTTVRIEWAYNINDAKAIRARCGYEFFEDDGNAIYEIAQWFPRLACYTDVNGWHHKQFLGRGEFTLELGDYLVRITVPSDHVVAATGVLQNPGDVLDPLWRQRLEVAASAETPVFVITPEEAKANEASASNSTKTWEFRAENVRDFAWASSRKFIWDAMGVEIEDGTPVMAMSFYPNEGEPIWSRFSTQAVAHTLEVFSKHTFPYPYPVAISVNGPVGGMEYPMICFNGPRPEKDGTYTKRDKYGLIGVVIHEVGHNWFPMIINSDERQWTWMDEGLNTFVQLLAQEAWEKDYPSRRGHARDIVEFMKSSDQVPIMTNSESLHQFGNNSYAKPATALNILRETILGRELFDFAFKEYCRRWKFKRPQPADFFRTMEDASGVDLDWFWRGWFYTTDHVDIAIDRVRLYEMDTRNPEIDKPARAAAKEAETPRPITTLRDEEAGIERRTDRFPELIDFYNTWDEDEDILPSEKKSYEEFLESLEPWERTLLDERDWRFYVVDFSNPGGLVMPILLWIEYTDASSEEIRIPAEIWRKNCETVSKLFVTEKEIRSIEIDRALETADVDRSNNFWPARPVKSRFQLFKEKEQKNPMQQLRTLEDESPNEAEGADDDHHDHD